MKHETNKNIKIQNSKPYRMHLGMFQASGFRLHRQRGFTLLETVVALGLIFSAMVGPVTLATRGIFFAKFSKNKLVAANLAQEGIELIRKMRDDNALSNPGEWDDGLEVGDWQTDVYSSSLTGFTGAPLLRDSVSGLYSYQAGGAVTLFTRRINIEKPSFDQLVVTSEV